MGSQAEIGARARPNAAEVPDTECPLAEFIEGDMLGPGLSQCRVSR